MGDKKGGSDAAFFLCLLAVAALGFGVSLQYPLAVLRAAGFGAVLAYVWRRRGEAVTVSPYPLLVGGFVLLTLGHAFSSTYFWVSFQHALNIALAAVLLAWAVRLFRTEPGKLWEMTVLVVAAIALAEVGIALFQRIQGGEMRPRGTFDNANYLSEFLAAAALLCMSRLLWKGDPRRVRYAEAGAGFLFLAAALTLSSSRGVLLASIPAFGVLLVSRFGLRKGGVLLAGVGIPALGLLGLRAAERFISPDLHNYSRWIIWKAALRTFLDHPFGVGLGGFKYYWFANQSPVEGVFRRYGKFADTAHSEYLEVLSGLGAVGFVLFLSVLACPLLFVLRNHTEIPEDRRSMAAGAAGVLVLSGVHALFNANFHVFGIFVLGAMMLGALLSSVRHESVPALTIPAWGRWGAIAVFAALLAASVSTAGGVYSFDRGERLLKAGDLPGAERAFRAAAIADPFRAAYPDALSAVHYRRYLEERPTAPDVRAIPGLLNETLRWEDRAKNLNPRELKYTLRLGRLFLERFRVRGEPSDAAMAFRLAGNALRINPFGVEALWHRADVLEAVGRRDEAARDLETAIAVEPNFCRGYARLAVLAATADPVAASRWSAMEEECRRKAAALPLEVYEKWLVEPSEGR